MKNRLLKTAFVASALLSGGTLLADAGGYESPLASEPMIMTWDTSDTAYKIPLISTGVAANCKVSENGAGYGAEFLVGDTLVQYEPIAHATDTEIKIICASPDVSIYINNLTTDIMTMQAINSTSSHITNISQWGTLGLKVRDRSFRGAIDLESTATDTLVNIGDDLTEAFAWTKKFNGNFGNINTSNVTNMRNMFYLASAFNQDISAWDTSNVTDMYGMFDRASAFNQNISAWNTSNVENMRNMFSHASAFNQDISAWDTSKVTSMRYMFNTAFSFTYADTLTSAWDINAEDEETERTIGGVTIETDTDGMFYGTLSNTATTFSALSAINTDDNAGAVTPFAGLTLTDDDSTAFTATITLDTGAKGTLSASSVASGTLTEVQTAIQAITFTPAENRVAVGSTETTTITLVVTADSANGTTTNTVVSTSINDAPTDITLNPTSVNQNATADTIVGGISSTDADPDEQFTYTIVSVDGDTNSAMFDIVDGDGGYLVRLKDANPSVGTYSVRVNVNDGDADFAKELTVTVVDNVDPVITTSGSLNMLNGSTAVTTVAGTDSESLSWSIGDVPDDSASFSITSDGVLTLNSAAVIGTKSSYTVTVEAFDGTNTITKALTITVLDPVILNYQGFLSNASGAVNETLSITFKLHDALTDGNEVWSSTKSVVITKGIYNVALGEAVMLNDLDIANNTYYLGVSIESNDEMTPRQIIAPSGYIKILLDRVKVLETPVG